MPQITRRQFVASMSALVVVAADAKSVEPVAVPILDTHTHFYDPTRPGGVPWPSKDDKVLYRPVLPEHFVALTKPLGVVGTVVVEASNRLEHNRWVLDLVDKHPALVGLVGRLEPGEPGFRENLELFAKHRRFYGIRIGHSLLKTRLNEKAFLADLDQLGDKSLVLDVNGGPELLPDVALLAEKLPDLQIVVNHLANVAIDGQTPPEGWRKGMLAAGKHKHVACKASAYVEGAARDGKQAPTDAAFYKPVFDVAWDAFGGDRLMFGSNWPVSERAAEYKTLLAIAQADLSGRKADAARFFAGNARTIYNVPDGQS